LESILNQQQSYKNNKGTKISYFHRSFELLGGSLLRYRTFTYDFVAFLLRSANFPIAFICHFSAPTSHEASCWQDSSVVVVLAV